MKLYKDGNAFMVKIEQRDWADIQKIADLYNYWAKHSNLFIDNLDDLLGFVGVVQQLGFMK